jgi:RNA polymerase sigma factor (sigma-70 family)
VWQVIDELPGACREVAALFAAGYEYAEIAEMLDISRGKVRNHVSRARQELRRDRGLREDGLP